MMKKIIAVLLMIVMVLPVTGCKTGKNEPLQKEVERLEKAVEKEKKEKKTEAKTEKSVEDEKAENEEK